MKPIRQFSPIFFVFLFATVLLTHQPVAAGRDYTYYLIGNGNNVTAATQGGLLLAGGGDVPTSAIQWMINQAGGGDVVVLRVTEDPYWNDIFYNAGTVDSVETLAIKTRAGAANSFVVDKIRNAEALFIAGGDQKDYIRLWKDTPVEDAIHDLHQQNVPIGGSSAGLAVLGEFAFSANRGTVYSDEMLANPYNKYATLERDFIRLPLMAGIITDTHFVARDRMGRLVGFLARIVKDGWTTQASAIAVDEDSAVVVTSSGIATLHGNGTAYYLRTPGMPEVCQVRTPLTYRNLSVYKVTNSSTFNITTWSGTGGTAYTVSAENGVLTSTQPGGSPY